LTTAIPPMTVFSELPSKLPAGYAAAMITPENSGVLRLCAVVRTETGRPGVEGGPFVVVRELLDCRVYLGCVTDVAGRVQRWVELWVQDLTGLAASLPAYRDTLNNRILDERWAERCEAFDRLGGAVGAGFGSGGIIRTGFEVQHPMPIYIDTKRMVPLPARDRRTGALWSLCENDGLLQRKGAWAYSTTLSRNLYQADSGEDSPILPLDGGAPDPASLGLPADAAPFNPSGGLMMVQPYCPISYEQYIDAITGGPSDTPAGDSLQKMLSGATTSAGGKAGGWLMLGGTGIAGRLVEALHLKLMALANAVSAVRASVMASQTPMLNLSVNSFRVRVAEGTEIIPLWWTARVALCTPGEAVELPLTGTAAKYYLPGQSGGLSIYSPASAGRVVQGRGWLRLRNVLSEGEGVILEGTLATQERLQAGANDLLWLRFGVGATRVDVYAVVDSQQAMAAGELRIRTVPQALYPEVVTRLKAALGVPIQDVSFEMVPLLSTPCDLYALGVLGVRTLLTDGKRRLPDALDVFMSLAFEAGRGAGEGLDLARRVGQAFEADKRFVESLGPQRLLFDCGDPSEAFEAIPPALWHRTLAMMIRMFTGLGPDSICRDFGDAPAGGVHKVLDPVLSDLYALVVSCRSLIVSDHSVRSELRDVVSGCLSGTR